LPSRASHNEKTGEIGEILLPDSNCLERKAFPYRGNPIAKMYGGALIEASERVCKLVALEPEHGSGALVRNARSRALR
jgi:hypothetical protein